MAIYFGRDVRTSQRERLDAIVAGNIRKKADEMVLRDMKKHASFTYPLHIGDQVRISLRALKEGRRRGLSAIYSKKTTANWSKEIYTVRAIDAEPDMSEDPESPERFKGERLTKTKYYLDDPKGDGRLFTDEGTDPSNGPKAFTRYELQQVNVSLDSLPAVEEKEVPAELPAVADMIKQDEFDILSLMEEAEQLAADEEKEQKVEVKSLLEEDEKKRGIPRDIADVAGRPTRRAKAAATWRMGHMKRIVEVIKVVSKARGNKTITVKYDGAARAVSITREELDQTPGGVEALERYLSKK